MYICSITFKSDIPMASNSDSKMQLGIDLKKNFVMFAFV